MNRKYKKTLKLKKKLHERSFYWLKVIIEMNYWKSCWLIFCWPTHFRSTYYTHLALGREITSEKSDKALKENSETKSKQTTLTVFTSIHTLGDNILLVRVTSHLFNMFYIQDLLKTELYHFRTAGAQHCDRVPITSSPKCIRMIWLHLICVCI